MSENDNSIVFQKNNILNGLKGEFKSSVKLLHVFKDYSNNINIISVTIDDKVYCSGHNSKGLLGFGHQNVIDENRINVDLSNKQIIEFKNSSYHAIAITFDGRLLCWGYNYLGSLGNGKNDKKIYKPKLNDYLSKEIIVTTCCGSQHTIVLTSNAEVYAWGYNNKGQVGNRSNAEFVSIPVKLKYLNGLKVKNISCGFWHSLVLTEDGCVFGWGNNVCKQLGIKNEKQFNSPNKIKLDNNIIIAKISCGLNHSVLLTNDGYIYVFGNNYNKQLGININSGENSMPLRLEAPNVFTNIGTHYDRNISYALSEDCSYYVWGYCGDYENFRIIKELGKSHMRCFEETFSEFLTYGEPLIYQDHIVENYIPYGKYTKFWLEKSLLGRGSYGEVWEVESKLKLNDPTTFAIKKIPIIRDPDDFINNNDSVKELLNTPIVLDFNSEFLVKYHEVWYENDFKIIDSNRKFSENFVIYIRMDLCDKTLSELFGDINSNFRTNSEKDLSRMGYYISSEIFIEIFKGVQYLHNNNIIHRDLNPSNILLKSGKIKIADFGLARVHDKNMKHSSDKGNRTYAAEEVIDGEDYDTKADIHSLGVILKELFIIKYKSPQYKSDELLKQKSDGLKGYIEKMLCVNPEKRPDCDKMIKTRKEWAIDKSDFNFKEELNVFIQSGVRTYLQSIICSKLKDIY